MVGSSLKLEGRQLCKAQPSKSDPESALGRTYIRCANICMGGRCVAVSWAAAHRARFHLGAPVPIFCASRAFPVKQHEWSCRVEHLKIALTLSSVLTREPEALFYRHPQALWTPTWQPHLQQ